MGSPSSPDELRGFYLNVASNRHLKRGDNTVNKGRLVKGRKGVGKFAGLYVGTRMQVDTCANEQHTYITFDKEIIRRAVRDERGLGEIPLDLRIESCVAANRGTTITISHLNATLVQPDASRVKRLLALEYCRSEGFNIFVNDEQLDVTDVGGMPHEHEATLPDVGTVRLRFVISHTKQRFREAGISLRVQTKIIDKPSFYDVRNRLPELPKKLLGRVFGEVEANELPDLLTMHWGPLAKDTRAHIALQEFVSSRLAIALSSAFQTEIALARGRLTQQLNRELQKLPEHKQEFARRAIEAAIQKHFLDIPEDKLGAIVSVIIEAINRDEYWYVLKLLDEARPSEVFALAEALREFGMIDLARTATTAASRRSFLNHLQTLASNPATTEQQMHKAIEENLWLLGPNNSPLISNQSLRTTVQALTGQNKYNGKNAAKRPDLLLSRDYTGRHLLIEFKRPSYTITNMDVAQAAEYRQELTPHVAHGTRIDLLIVGGRLGLDAQYAPGGTAYADATTFTALISDASVMLDWLTTELAKGK